MRKPKLHKIVVTERKGVEIMREKLALLSKDVIFTKEEQDFLSEHTSKVVTLIREEIEKVENPYDDCKLHSSEGFEKGRQAILKALEAE